MVVALGLVVAHVTPLSTADPHSAIPRRNNVGNVDDGWFATTENSDYIQAIGLSSAKFQHSLSILRPIAPQVYPYRSLFT